MNVKLCFFLVAIAGMLAMASGAGERPFSSAGIPTDRSWPDNVTRAVRGGWTIVVNDSGASVTVPAERGRMVVGEASWQDRDSLCLPANGVAVFEQGK